MDESKQKFEKWFGEHMYIGSKCIADPATKRRMFCAWIAAWQASREAIALDMPEPFKLAKSSSGLTYYYQDEVDAVLSCAGINVKE
ncbi:hypothetical protein ACEV6G_08225 [Enterobacter ludwigii]|uniref:hypothetical protein n=1 Tax=Enterobacter ludwigii TaxID=299767 RepID=UPI003BEEB55E